MFKRNFFGHNKIWGVVRPNPPVATGLLAYMRSCIRPFDQCILSRDCCEKMYYR